MYIKSTSWCRKFYLCFGMHLIVVHFVMLSNIFLICLCFYLLERVMFQWRLWGWCLTRFRIIGNENYNHLGIGIRTGILRRCFSYNSKIYKTGIISSESKSNENQIGYRFTFSQCVLPVNGLAPSRVGSFG